MIYGDSDTNLGNFTNHAFFHLTAINEFMTIIMFLSVINKFSTMTNISYDDYKNMVTHSNDFLKAYYYASYPDDQTISADAQFIKPIDAVLYKTGNTGADRIARHRFILSNIKVMHDAFMRNFVVSSVNVNGKTIEDAITGKYETFVKSIHKIMYVYITDAVMKNLQDYVNLGTSLPEQYYNTLRAEYDNEVKKNSLNRVTSSSLLAYAISAYHSVDGTNVEKLEFLISLFVPMMDFFRNTEEMKVLQEQLKEISRDANAITPTKSKNMLTFLKIRVDTTINQRYTIKPNGTNTSLTLGYNNNNTKYYEFVGDGESGKNISDKEHVKNRQNFIFGPFTKIFMPELKKIGTDKAEAEYANVMNEIGDDNGVILKNLNDKKNIVFVMYGASGAGKTATMFSLDVDDKNIHVPGVIPRLLDKLHANVTVKFVELFQYKTANMDGEDVNTNDKLNESNDPYFHMVSFDGIVSKDNNGNYRQDPIKLKKWREKRIMYSVKRNFTYTNGKLILEKNVALGEELDKSDNVGAYDKLIKETFSKPEYMKGVTLSEYVKTAMGAHRETNPTPNNPVSSRSHFAVVLDVAGKGKILVWDFAGVENEFKCGQDEVKDRFFGLLKKQSERQKKKQQKQKDANDGILDRTKALELVPFKKMFTEHKLGELILSDTPPDLKDVKIARIDTLVRSILKKYVKDGMSIEVSTIEKIINDMSFLIENRKINWVKKTHSDRRGADQLSREYEDQRTLTSIPASNPQTFSSSIKKSRETAKKTRLNYEKTHGIIDYKNIWTASFWSYFIDVIHDQHKHKKNQGNWNGILVKSTVEGWYKNMINTIADNSIKTSLAELSTIIVYKYIKSKNVDSGIAIEECRKRVVEGRFINDTLRHVRSLMSGIMKARGDSPKTISKCQPLMCSITGSCIDNSSSSNSGKGTVVDVVMRKELGDAKADVYKDTIFCVFNVLNISTPVGIGGGLVPVDPFPDPFIDVSELQYELMRFDSMRSKSLDVFMADMKNNLFLEGIDMSPFVSPEIVRKLLANIKLHKDSDEGVFYETIKKSVIELYRNVPGNYHFPYTDEKDFDLAGPARQKTFEENNGKRSDVLTAFNEIATNAIGLPGIINELSVKSSSHPVATLIFLDSIAKYSMNTFSCSGSITHMLPKSIKRLADKAFGEKFDNINQT